uniref:Uncharacterized protein n=1 Tax=Cacopsylla melanoneura TaxID=428564 RepID=A0A8D8S1R2_9HEMI
MRKRCGRLTSTAASSTTLSSGGAVLVLSDSAKTVGVVPFDDELLFKPNRSARARFLASRSAWHGAEAEEEEVNEAPLGLAVLLAVTGELVAAAAAGRVPNRSARFLRISESGPGVFGLPLSVPVLFVPVFSPNRSALASSLASVGRSTLNFLERNSNRS